MWQPQGFYNQYVLRTPVILTGEKSVQGLYNYPAVKIAVIHGKSFKDQDLFKETFRKKSIQFFDRSWNGEPDIAGLAGTIGQLEEFRPDTIIAVGGGSVIDGAKICRLFLECPYYVSGETRLTGNVFKTKFIVAPTTIGSGAEVSSAAVFVDHNTHSKDMVVMHDMQPEILAYDKRYVEQTPKRLLVASALDAMAHIVEGYVSVINNSFIDVMAETGLSILHSELEKLLADGKNIDFERLMYAGYLGGLVQNHCIVGAAHGVAHQLTDHGFSHGEAIGLLLSGVMVLNAEIDTIAAKYEKISRRAGFSDYSQLQSFIEKLLTISGIADDRMNLKRLLADLVKQKDLCERIRNDQGGKGNPVPMSEEYLKKLVEII
ncbi:Alcohol dehydrogenase [Anaerovibrio sp. JC8]|uniref:iron-containing alcohol dehydrogenase n=1 Tax=Anaerovibrio sp. JC8 TaxID=1240085 RepID=UPI000A0DEB5F|nr:iron-containing alcohol dehydrogenase [Anaerovibrio sp. JC8]ORU00567.1 Alcohol dehydrogenase [Anaerovibrio sp. JC8]